MQLFCYVSCNSSNKIQHQVSEVSLSVAGVSHLEARLSSTPFRSAGSGLVLSNVLHVIQDTPKNLAGLTLVMLNVFHETLKYINSSPPGQNGRHFADDSFKHIFMNEKCFISIRISLKFVPNGPIDNKAALVQVMAWRRTGDKPLPEPMLAQFTDAYMRL